MDTFLTVEDFTLDQTLVQYANEADKYQEIILIMLAGTIGEGLMGAGELFDKGALCLIEAESDTKPSAFAHTFLSTGKAHLELSIPEMGEFIEVLVTEEQQKMLLGRQSPQDMLDRLAGFLEQAQKRYIDRYGPVTPRAPKTS